MFPRKQSELASERREAARLDLDQQVAADDVDDEAVDDLLDTIAAASVPVLELSVKCALVECPDRRGLDLALSDDLVAGMHDRLLLRANCVAFTRSRPARVGAGVRLA